MLDNDFRQIFNPCVKQDRLNKAKDGLNTGTSNIYWAAYASFMKIAPNTTGQIRIILAICCALSAAVEPANAQTWIPATVPTNYWSCVASSADGTKLVVAGSGYINGMETSYIYTSTNSGAAWMPSVAPTNYVWNSIASSANGTKLVVTTGSFFPTSGKIYVSTNSGTTWTEVTPTNLYWASVASSADGTKLAAVGSPGFTGGFVYTSTNSGTTWTQQTNAPNIGWFSIISSADGSKLVVQVPDTIYGSTNSGVTWAQITPPPILWPGRSSSQVIASSADGTRLFAAFNGDQNLNPCPVYISTNSGSSWTATSATSNNWICVAASADGTKLVVLATIIAGPQDVGPIYTSTNSGSSWTSNSVPNQEWTSAACSADGNTLVAVSGI